MVATHEGGIKSAKTIKQKYGVDFFRRIGQQGGRKSRGGGFASSHDLAVRAGRLGGLARGKNYKSRSATARSGSDKGK